MKCWRWSPCTRAILRPFGHRARRWCASPAPAARGFRPDLNLLEAAITPRTRALFFATPNNPSGVILSEQELAAIGDLARRHSLWLVADEVYAGLAPGGRVPGLAARLPEQVITVSSLSKSHSMPGLAGRLAGGAQAAGQARGIALDVHAVRPAGFHSGGGDHGARRVRDRRNRGFASLCTARRDMLLTGLDGVRGIRCSVPDAGMFTLIDVRGTGLSGYDFMCGLYRVRAGVGDRWRRVRCRDPRVRASVLCRR